MTKSCSSFMIASNRAAIFAHTADIMKPMLPYLLHKVHASNSYWCLTVPTAAHSTVSICFHTFKVFHLTHSGIRLMQMQVAEFSSYKLQVTCHNMSPAFHNEMRMELLCPTSLHPWTNLARLFSWKHSDKIKFRRFHKTVWIAVPHTSWDMHHFSCSLVKTQNDTQRASMCAISFRLLNLPPRTMGEEKFVFENISLESWIPCLCCCFS